MTTLQTAGDALALLMGVINAGKAAASNKGAAGQPEIEVLNEAADEIQKVGTDLPLSIFLTMAKVRLLALEEEVEEGGNPDALIRVGEVVDALDEARRVADLD